MPRTTGPSTNPRIISGYTPYSDRLRSKSSASTTEGRRQLLLQDPHARDIQPEQVTCTHCAKIVRLQKGKSFHLAHWLDHRWRCDRARAEPLPKAKSLNLAERKAVLEADGDAKVVEPDRVVCSKCDRVVRLRKGRPYGLSCWNQHKSTCQIALHPSNNSSGSGLTLPSLPHLGAETYSYDALKTDPLVASIESQRIKCTLCLAWINVELQHERAVREWRRHRTTCVAGYFASDAIAWTLPDFTRPRHRFGSGSEVMGNHVYDSSADTPPSPPSTLSRRTATRATNQLYSGNILPITRENASSRSPPHLSFSTATSVTNSMAPTPLPSPRFEASLFPNLRHLPFPPGPSALQDRKHKECRLGFDALGHLSLPRSLPSCSPNSDQCSRPPPHLEFTPLSLSLPVNYWRFENIEYKGHPPPHAPP